MKTPNDKQFLVNVNEHYVDINDRSPHFNNTMHVIKDTGQHKAGDTILIHTFKDVGGYDRMSLTIWRDGQCIKTNIDN